MPNPLEQLLMLFQPEQDLGLSPQSAAVGDVLGQAQAAGIKPPVPAEAEVHPLIQLLAALQAQQVPPAPADAAIAPAGPASPAQELQGLVTPRAASANAPDNVALLKALLQQ